MANIAPLNLLALLCMLDIKLEFDSFYSELLRLVSLTSAERNNCHKVK